MRLSRVSGADRRLTVTIMDLKSGCVRLVARTVGCQTSQRVWERGCLRSAVLKRDWKASRRDRQKARLIAVTNVELKYVTAKLTCSWQGLQRNWQSGCERLAEKRAVRVSKMMTESCYRAQKAGSVLSVVEQWLKGGLSDCQLAINSCQSCIHGWTACWQGAVSWQSGDDRVAEKELTGINVRLTKV